MKLIDADGNTVPIGEKGEICIRGYSVMNEYWNDKKATEDTITSDKWLKSGDLG